MAAAVRDSHVGAGKKLKTSLKKKKKMKMVARAVASELEEEGKDATDSGGNALGLNCGLLKRKVRLKLGASRGCEWLCC